MDTTRSPQPVRRVAVARAVETDEPRLDDHGRRIYTMLAYGYRQVDRHGTAIRQGTWTNLGQEVPFQLWHDGHQWPIGKVLNSWEDKHGVWAEFVFDEDDELAVKAKGKLDRGFMWMVSIGFNPTWMGAGENPVEHAELYGEKDVWEYIGQELLEVSLVNVGSNRSAKVVRELAAATGLDAGAVLEALDECDGGSCGCRATTPAPARVEVGLSDELRRTFDELRDAMIAAAEAGVELPEVRLEFPETRELHSTGDHTGSAMVALMLAPDAADALALDGGDTPDQLHITLAYLGDADSLNTREAYRSVAAAAMSADGPLEGKVTGVGRFDGGDEDPLLALVSVPGLDALRARVIDALGWNDIDDASEHGWTPHITLGLLDHGDTTPFDHLEGIDLRFDGITLAVGGQRWTVPFPPADTQTPARGSEARTVEDEHDSEPTTSPYGFGFNAWL